MGPYLISGQHLHAQRIASQSYEFHLKGIPFFVDHHYCALFSSPC